MNLTYKITTNDTVKATYTYIADGTKASVADSAGNSFDYLGSFVYVNDNNVRTLESTSFGGGRINKTNNAYDINYFITDHLGSTRVIVGANGAVKAQYNYYPFGKQWEDANLMANTNRYTFSGKERQTVKNLGYLDFGNRMYDAEIGRWFVQDPLQEKFYSWSSYNYCFNNPLKFVDPDGKWPTTFFGIRIPGTDVHKRILKMAFKEELKSGEITKKQLNIMAKAGRTLDKKFQAAEFSYMHSMTDGKTNQSVEEAKEKRTTDLIEPSIETFLDTDKSEEERFTALGEALHAITDEDTPSHQWQSWEGNGIENIVDMAVHTIKEIPVSKADKEAMQRSVEAAKRFYELIRDKLEEMQNIRQ